MKTLQNKGRLLVIAGIMLVMVALSHVTGFSRIFRLENTTLLRDWVAGFGRAGAVAYILLYIAACILLLPGFPITILGALAFGPVMGTVYTSIGSTLGATAAFLIARYAARDMVENWLAGNETLRRIDAGVKKQGWRMLMITRMVPLFPFNLQNFAYGLTRINRKAAHTRDLSATLVVSPSDSVSEHCFRTGNDRPEAVRHQGKSELSHGSTTNW